MSQVSMVKLVYCVTKKVGLTDEEFFRYWENSHGPIGARIPGLRKLVQSHRLTVSGDKHRPDYDGMAELWFDDVEALLAARQSPEWKSSSEDEANFIDHSKVAYFVSDERTILQDSQTAKDQKTSIAPMLSVRNGARAVEFYKAAFGAREVFRIGDERRGVVAQLAAGKSEFWVADESPEHLNFSPESLGGGTVRMVMVVDDPGAAFNRAVAAGASVVRPVEDQPHGWLGGRIVDPFGHHWEIGKTLGG
jgi:PhnB protein